MSDDEVREFVVDIHGPREQEREDLHPDPFSKAWDSIKTMSGMDANFRRKTSRVAKVADTTAYTDSTRGRPEGRQGAGSNQINPGDVYTNGYGAFDVITPPYNLYQLASFFDTSFANHSAVNAKVASVVGTGFSLQMTPRAMQKLQDESDAEKQDKIRKKVERVRVDTLDWMDSLNNQETFTDIMVKVMTDYEATGNGYIEIGRTTGGKIGYVGHIPSATLRVRRRRDGYVQIIGQKVVYFRNFGADNGDPIGADPNPNEIIHLKKYSPLNTYYGVPDVVSAISSVVGDQQAEIYNLEYFQNKAVPRYIITLKGAKLSPSAEEKLFKFLQTNLKGQSHRTIFIPLPADSEGNKVEFKLEPVENKIQDASFEKYRKGNRDNTLMAHQVPLSKLGLNDGSSVASALTQERTFRDQVVRPSQRYVEKVVKPIVSEFTDIIEVKFNEQNIVDETAMANIHEIYANIGAIQPNEIREDLGRPQIEGLDDKVWKALHEQKQQATTGSARDAQDRQRSQQASDSTTSATGRNPKGSGAKEDGNAAQ